VKNLFNSIFILFSICFLASSFTTEPKVKSITGKITSLNGEDLAGAQIKKDITTSSFSNFNGEFTITFDKPATDSVTIHLIGYKPLTKKATSLYNNCVITLEEL
jgi:hypothetical protein